MGIVVWWYKWNVVPIESCVKDIWCHFINDKQVALLVLHLNLWELRLRTFIPRLHPNIQTLPHLQIHRLLGMLPGSSHVLRAVQTRISSNPQGPCRLQGSPLGLQTTPDFTNLLIWMKWLFPQYAACWSSVANWEDLLGRVTSGSDGGLISFVI